MRRQSSSNPQMKGKGRITGGAVRLRLLGTRSRMTEREKEKKKIDIQLFPSQIKRLILRNILQNHYLSLFIRTLLFYIRILFFLTILIISRV